MLPAEPNDLPCQHERSSEILLRSRDLHRPLTGAAAQQGAGARGPPIERRSGAAIHRVHLGRDVCATPSLNRRPASTATLLGCGTGERSMKISGSKKYFRGPF